MKIFIERDSKKMEMEFSGTGLELLKKLELMEAEVVLSRNGEIIGENEKLVDTDDVKILSVISGG